MGAETKRLQLNIGGLACSFCAQTLEKAYRRLDGVQRVAISLAHEEAMIEYDPSKLTEASLKKTLRQLGYTVRDPNRVRSFEEEEAELTRERNRLLLAAGFTAVAAALMVAMWLGAMQAWFPWLMLVLAIATVFGAGAYILRMAFQSFRRGILNQHVLLEFAALAGLTGGLVGFFLPEFPETEFFGVSVFVTTYHILSGYVSFRVRTRASRAIRKLLALQPLEASVLRNGEEQVVGIDEVAVDERVRIRPGEKIPVDGEVVEGGSSVNESLVTGESLPIEKELGSEVVAGSLNDHGSLIVRVTRVGEESFLRKVARHIQEARALKPGIVGLADRVLTFYVPGVLAFAGLALIIWTLGSWLLIGSVDVVRAIFAALAVLVMGYPCALGMATPLAMIRGGGMAAERGVLLRSAEAFQAFRHVNRVVFDKTGTLTQGKPQVSTVAPTGGWSASDVVRWAAAVEVASDHLLGRAIVDYARSQGVRWVEARDFMAYPGKGAEARVEDRKVRVGRLTFLEGEGTDIEGLRPQAKELEATGNTVVGVTVDGQGVGLLGIGDPLKDKTVEVVSRLKALGLQPMMLTGDNPTTAREIGRQVGIDEVLAEVLPGEKAERVRALQQEGARVAFVGDGMNDAPALMQADVGVAIGAGTDIAIESADVVLVGHHLNGLLDAYHIAINSYRKTAQNLVLAFMFNGIGVPAATTGLVYPVWAMVAMIASVSTVLANSFGGRLIPKIQTRLRSDSAMEAKTQPAEGHEIRFEIPSLHCEGCANAIRQLLRRQVPSAAAEVDVASQTVRIHLADSEIGDEGIAEILAEHGFAPLEKSV